MLSQRSFFRILLGQIHWRTHLVDLMEFIGFVYWIFRVLTSPERWGITLFSQSALISELCLKYLKNWNTILSEIEITFADAFLLCLHVKNCYPVLFYAICGSATKCRFTPISSSYISLCLMTFVPVRKWPSKVPSDRG